MAIAFGIIEKSGAWFSYDGNRLGQGKDNVRRLIESDRELMDKLEALVRERAMKDGFDDETIGDEDDFEIKDFDDDED